MPEVKSPSDLSMAEILATMRRIIAEDEEPGGTPLDQQAADHDAAEQHAAEHRAAEPHPSDNRLAAPTDAAGVEGDRERAGASQPQAGEDVLELTEALNEDGTVRHLAPSGGSSPRRPEGPELQEPRLQEPRLQEMELSEIQPEAAANPTPPTPQGEEPHTVANPAPADARPEPLVSEVTSFAAAAAFAHLAAIPRDKGAPQSPRIGERTLEDLVAELLQPVLRTWLDDNLPQLVERLVQREINRVVTRAGIE